MTKILEEAFALASELPQEEQNALGRRLIAELNEDAKWNASFAASQDELKILADEALDKFNESHRDLDPKCFYLNRYWKY